MLGFILHNRARKHKRNKVAPSSDILYYDQQGVEVRPVPCLLDIPNEVVTSIFGYLNCKDLLQCSSACNKFYALSQFLGLWKDLYFAAYPKPYQHNKGSKHNEGKVKTHWKAHYMHKNRIESNWKKGRCKQQVLTGHIEPVWGVQFHKTHLVSGSEGGEIRVWNLSTGKYMHSLRGHADFVNTFHFSGDNVASGGDDFVVKLWKASTGECVHTFSGHELPVWMVEFAENTLVSGSCDKTLRLWDMNTGRGQLKLNGHTGRIYYLQVKENMLVSGSQDKSCRVWDMRSGQCVQQFTTDSAAHCLQINKDNSIASGHGNGNVCVWSMRTGCMQSKLATGLHPVAHLQSTGDKIITSSRENLYLWDLKSSTNSPMILKGHTDDIKYFQLRGDRLVSGGFDTSIKIWNITDDIRPNSPLCASDHVTRNLLTSYQWYNEMKPAVSLEGHQGRVDWLEFKSEKLVSCSSDCTIRVWDFS